MSIIKKCGVGTVTTLFIACAIVLFSLWCFNSAPGIYNVEEVPTTSDSNAP